MANTLASYGNYAYAYMKQEPGISLVIMILILCAILAIYTIVYDPTRPQEQDMIEPFGVIEGNTTMKQSELENILKASETHSINNESTHLVNALESNHRDILEQMQSTVNRAMIAEISNTAQTISKDPTADSSIKHMNKIVKMKEFNDAIKESIQFYDDN